MTIEGVLAYEGLRDFLYERMRGARDGRAVAGAAMEPSFLPGETTALTEALQAAAMEIRAVRELVEGRTRTGG
jgi:hypothetical protein